MERRIFLKLIANTIATTTFSSLVGWKVVFGSQNKELLRKEFYAMGTRGRIQLYAESESLGNLAMEEAHDKIRYLDYKLSKFLPDSDIGRLNASPGKFLFVAEDTVNLLNLGMDITHKTHFRFDMGMGNFLTQPGLDEYVPKVGDRDLTFSELKSDLVQIDGRKVCLSRVNTMLDLGAIGKGYAIDIAMDTLCNKYGIKHAVIELGGDLRVTGGQPNGQPWTIKLDPQAPLSTQQKKEFQLKEGGVASSGGYLKRATTQSAKIKHHIVDPLSFSSHEIYALSTVIGPRAVICDALATAAYNTPPKEQHSLQQAFSDYVFMNQSL